MKSRKLLSWMVPLGALLGLFLLAPASGLGQAGAPPKAAASAPSGVPSSAPATTSAPAMRCAHVFVSGKVQGVNYRGWTVEQATALGITGWVKNLADSRVEAVLEGPADSVKTLIEKMHRGSPAAVVSDVKVEDRTPTGEFKTFEVRQ